MRTVICLAAFLSFPVLALAQAASVSPPSPGVFSLNPQDVGKTVVLMQRGNLVPTLEVTFNHEKQAELKQLVTDHPGESIQIKLEDKVVAQETLKPPTGHSIKVRTYKTPDEAFAEAKRLVGADGAVITAPAPPENSAPSSGSVVLSITPDDVTDVNVFQWRRKSNPTLEIVLIQQKQDELNKLLASHPGAPVLVSLEGKMIDCGKLPPPAGRSIKIETYRTPGEAFAEAKLLIRTVSP